MSTLSIVIPVYNESKRLDRAFKALGAIFDTCDLTLENIIFVNDGSTDTSYKKLIVHKTQIEKKLNTNVSIISYEKNRGKGYAIKTGMLASQSDYTLFFDADISTPLEEFKRFGPFLKIELDVIIGTRKNGKSLVVKAQPLYRRILGKGFTILSNVILNTKVSDFTCGFKIFSRKAKDEIFTKSIIERWGYDAEIMYLAKKLKYSIQEVPVHWSNDERSKVSVLKDITSSLKELFTIHFNSFMGKYSKRMVLRTTHSLRVGTSLNNQ